MINRPHDAYVRQLRAEPPLKSERRRLVTRLNMGGVKEFEVGVVCRMEGVSLNQPGVTHPIDGDFMKWLYVGESWWCRQRTKRRAKKCRPYYEFARMVAVGIENGRLVVCGLWDSRRHKTEQPPVSVKRVGDPKSRGYITGRNEFEVMVVWDGGPTTPQCVRKFDELEFDYVEDYLKFKKIFANLKKLP